MSVDFGFESYEGGVEILSELWRLSELLFLVLDENQLTAVPGQRLEGSRHPLPAFG